MDHLFHKKLQEKHNLEWQLPQANLKLKNLLKEKLNKLLTESGGPTITDGNQGSGNVTATPIGGGRYVSPSGVPGGVNPSISPYTKPDFSWKKVPWNPNLPENPSPPQTVEEWDQNNPPPSRDDYADGQTGQDNWERDYRQWKEARERIIDNYNRWRYEVRNRNRQLPGQLTRNRPYYGA